MLDDMLPGFSLPAIGGKKVTAAFDGGRLSSDGGVFLLAAADQRLGLTETLAGLIPDPRDPAASSHSATRPADGRTGGAPLPRTRGRWTCGGPRSNVSRD